MTGPGPGLEAAPWHRAVGRAWKSRRLACHQARARSAEDRPRGSVPQAERGGSG